MLKRILRTLFGPGERPYYIAIGNDHPAVDFRTLEEAQRMAPIFGPHARIIHVKDGQKTRVG